MTEANRIASLILSRFPVLKRGTMRFWGQWFGRPYDNIHTVVGASAEGDVLEVRFDNGETLRVLRPGQATLGSGEFRIGSALRVRWEWNSYGDPPGRRYFEEYVREGTEVTASTDFDFPSRILRPSAAEAAVEIL